MSDKSNSDSNNSWIFVGPEGPAMETIGPMQDVLDNDDGKQEHPEDTRHPAPSSKTEAKELKQEISAGLVSKEPKAAEELVTASAAETLEKESDVVTLTASERRASEEVEIPEEEEAEPTDSDLGTLIGRQYSSLTDKADEDVEELESSSSEESVEGLRRRQVGEKNPPPTADTIEKGETEQGDKSNVGISLNKCILAALVLAFVGFALFSGPVEDNLGTHEVREAHITQSPNLQVDPQGLVTMTALLDKVAKESQEIRLMQAELQTQKLELEALLKKNEEQLSLDPPQQTLVQENLRLKDSLKQQETALASLQEELLFMRERLRALEVKSIDTEIFQSENQKLKEELNHERKQVEGFLTQKETLMAESQMLRQELDKQRRLVESVKQELENLTVEVAPTDAGIEHQLLREGLEEMEKKLAMELQQSENWVKNYIQSTEKNKMRSEEFEKKGNKIPADAVATEAPDGQPAGKLKKFSDSVKSTLSTEKETVGAHIQGKREEKGKVRNRKEWKGKYETWRQQKQEHWAHKKGDEPKNKKHEGWKEKKDDWKMDKPGGWRNKIHERWRDKSEQWKEKKTDGYPDKKEHGENKHHDQPKNKDGDYQRHTEGLHHHKESEKFREDKYYKDSENNQRKKQWEKSEEQSGTGSKHRHHDHNKFWKEISDHQYRVPEGCQGISDCARKEGMSLFNVALEPVTKQEFHQLVKKYLEKMNGSKYLADLEAFLSGFFEDGVFIHDRMRFKDFVDDVEDYLEDIAKKEYGNDDAVDDFDDQVFKHFFGEDVVKSSKEKHKKQQNTDKMDQTHKHNDGYRFFKREQRHKQMENWDSRRKEYGDTRQEVKAEASHYHSKSEKHPPLS